MSPIFSVKAHDLSRVINGLNFHAPPRVRKQKVWATALKRLSRAARWIFAGGSDGKAAS
jgi:hypothetical protein